MALRTSDNMIKPKNRTLSLPPVHNTGKPILSIGTRGK